jgi:hypothetical protein
MTGTALGRGRRACDGGAGLDGVTGVAAVIGPMFCFLLGLGLANPSAVAGAVAPIRGWWPEGVFTDVAPTLRLRLELVAA